MHTVLALFVWNDMVCDQQQQKNVRVNFLAQRYVQLSLLFFQCKECLKYFLTLYAFEEESKWILEL